MLLALTGIMSAIGMLFQQGATTAKIRAETARIRQELTPATGDSVRQQLDKLTRAIDDLSGRSDEEHAALWSAINNQKEHT